MHDKLVELINQVGEDINTFIIFKFLTQKSKNIK